MGILLTDTFHINPQLHLILSDMEEVVISLNQHSVMEPKVSWQITVYYLGLSYAKPYCDVQYTVYKLMFLCDPDYMIHTAIWNLFYIRIKI